MKFIVVPDIHYLQDNHSSSDDIKIVRGEGMPTEPKNYKDRLQLLVETLKKEEMDFFIANGDLVHDDPTYLPAVKQELDKVGVPYHVSFGNHDRATESYWQSVWGHDRNTDFSHGEYAFVLPRSADETGARVAVDTDWLSEKLQQYADKKGILMVTHVPQTDHWRNSPDATEVRQLLKQSDNFIGAVFSHVHGAITTERVDDLIFSMTGHFAHYGRRFYSIRRFGIDESDVITTELYDITNHKVIDRHLIRKEASKWLWGKVCLQNGIVTPL